MANWRAGVGYAVLEMPAGEKDERDTFTCAHCQYITRFNPAHERPEDKGGMCKQCAGLICKRCVGKDCLPIEKWLDMQENPGKHFGQIHGGFKLHQVKRA